MSTKIQTRPDALRFFFQTVTEEIEQNLSNVERHEMEHYAQVIAKMLGMDEVKWGVPLILTRGSRLEK